MFQQNKTKQTSPHLPKTWPLSPTSTLLVDRIESSSDEKLQRQNQTSVREYEQEAINMHACYAQTCWSAENCYNEDQTTISRTEYLNWDVQGFSTLHLNDVYYWITRTTNNSRHNVAKIILGILEMYFNHQHFYQSLQKDTQVAKFTILLVYYKGAISISKYAESRPTKTSVVPRFHKSTS